MNSVCPSKGCGGRMVDGECDRCGVLVAKKGRRNREHMSEREAAESTHDGQCMFEHDASRCVMPGNLSSGSVKEWFCRYHSRDGNRGHGADQDEFMRTTAHPDGRQAVMDAWYPSGTREIVEAQLGQFERTAGETRSEYIDRCRTLARKATSKRLEHAANIRRTATND